MDWGRIATVGAALLVLVLALVAGRLVVRAIPWRPPRRAPLGPVPASWMAILDAHVPAFARLPDPDRHTLLQLMQEFLRDKHFEGAGGLVVTEEMQITIAAQACLLILHLDGPVYPDCRTILVYPSTFMPRRVDPYRANMIVPQPITAELGETATRSGVVVLAWDAVVGGARDPDVGSNVTLHEFAHQLDMEDGGAEGVPILEPPSSLRTWATVLSRRFEELRQDVDAGRESVLSAYAATNKAEFFAVATERFFERPADLLRDYPDLYEELRKFYRQDPARS
jgi:Mlc titration factor MtfA (ptsG expression regulator)